MREFYKLLHENDIPFGDVKLEDEEEGKLVEMRLSVILQKNEEDSAWQIKSDTKKKEEVSSFGCPECGSDNLEFEAWVNQHNDIINYGDQIWCNDCSESVKDIVSKSEYKKEVA